VGRPSEYSPELIDELCGRLCEGRSLRSICKDEGMPSTATVFRWLREHPEFQEQYARAKREGVEALVDEIPDIADDGSNDWMEKLNADGEQIGWTLNGEHVQRSKLRIDARKWIAAKLAPKLYGEKVDLNHGGSVTYVIETGVEGGLDGGAD
jgi:hypothetical protein